MNRQQSFNRYLSTSRTLFSENARATRRKRIAVAALIGATVIVAAALQPAKAADASAPPAASASPAASAAPVGNEMVIRTMGPVSYVCGGVAEDERARLAAQEKNFNMGILFTRGADGEYLADVDVKLTRDGQNVADFRAGGPRCLIRAPEGSYNIEASYKGQSKSIKISTGTRNAQLRW
ncbi:MULTISPECIES: hypothetical protein [unclassified Cupriavidus]|uniref:hypothetical protein n=1 Tax=unclassified Cupriavidus TaxID=2640874 RepID=UPI001C008943|nr:MULTISPECIES: hypothetical protein [unclassified Cupriavidus]MCA3187947.1 hypothetical protein [Cupriavidus sp.]MCA3189791.1 hypothetical protein [Cupriavidus sp.]MCA3196385.1 hypothetical protein [Cupriavidus sp.]MCA3202130.1 hypothetical protein [Cupriavidus sp.]MCA3232851.1 hypothetical protein [Cupriavidus sp.]